MIEPELSLFTLPKPFVGHIGTIQRNAILSWLRLMAPSRVILLGSDEGISEAAAEFGLTHVPSIPTTQLGTPLLDAAFRIAQQTSETELIGYINTDILLPGEFINALAAIPFEKFLAVGNRWNVEVSSRLDPDPNTFDSQMRSLIESGQIQPAKGSDYFIFRKKTLGEIPPFAVGRPGWDNWLIFHARTRKLKVVDLSPHILVVHQNHDYSHVPSRLGSGWEGPEADENRRMVGGWDRMFTLHDATHVLQGGVVRRAISYPYLRRKLASAPALHPWLRPIARTWAKIRGGSGD